MIFRKNITRYVVSAVILLAPSGNLSANEYNSDEIGEYNFHENGTGLWDCAQVGMPDSYESILTVSHKAIGFYLPDEAITFEDFKFTSVIFRRNYYVSALADKWIAFHNDNNGKSSELEFSYEFGILTKRVYESGIATTSNYLCQKRE